MIACLNKNILITGVAGFVGYGLGQRLTREGWRVRGSVRFLSDHVRLPPGVEGVPVGTIGPDTSWATALQGVDTIVHLAARTHVIHETEKDPLSAYRLTNVAGTERLASVAAGSGVRRFIFMSSIKVNGEGRDEPYTPGDLPAPEDPYGISKWETEQALMRIAEQSGMEVVVLRPPLVYGPGVKGNFLQLLKVVDRGVPLPFSSIRNRRSLIYVGNLIDATVACIAKPEAAGKTYLVSDGEDVSTPELIRRMAQALGRRSCLFPCPMSSLRLFAKLVRRTSMVERLAGSLTIDSAGIRNELGWSPPHMLDEGLGETVKWFKKQE